MPYNIQADIILPEIRAAHQKQALGILASEIAAQTQCSGALMLDHLLEKEMKSSSGIGDGVAIPHLKISGLKQRLVVLATLHTPVDFKAIDDKPVDIICTLISPEEDGPIHLRGLSRISRLFKNKRLCQRIRETDDAATIQSLFNDPEGWLLAA